MIICGLWFGAKMTVTKFWAPTVKFIQLSLLDELVVQKIVVGLTTSALSLTDSFWCILTKASNPLVIGPIIRF